MGLTKSELVGTYRLLYGGIERANGIVEYPYGEGAIGYLVYLDNDRVSWHVMAADRLPFSNPDLLGGRPEENDRAFRTSNGYFGKYTIEGERNTIRHRGSAGAQHGGPGPQPRAPRGRRTPVDLETHADRWVRGPHQVRVEARGILVSAAI